MARFAAPPEAVAEVIEKAIAATNPKTRYKVTLAARVLMGLRRVPPDRAFDAFLRTQFPPPAQVKLECAGSGQTTSLFKTRQWGGRPTELRLQATHRVRVA